MKKLLSFLLIFTLLVSSITCVYASDNSKKYVYRNSTFQYKIMPDPNHVTDEDFFGEWDEKNEMWIQEPDFNYEGYPGLADVEKAAKKGDYKAAKEALMAYYTPQKYDKINKVNSITNANILESEKMERNFHATNSTGVSLDIVDGVTEDWNRISSTDVLSHVKAAVEDGNPYVAFVIASIDKSNTAAEIKSRDTDSPPTLNLVVNKVQMSFEACEDTYISPNLNANVNYGNEEILYAQEYGYVGHWALPKGEEYADQKWGDEASETKRTYIKFDLSSLSSTASISSASFDFTARVSPGGDLTEKELFIYGWQDASWNESSLCWNSFTDWLFFTANEQEAWSYVTSDITTEKGKLCYYHRGSLLSQISQVYDATGEEKYAHNFIRQMMSCIYHVDAGHDNIVMNALDHSNHLSSMGNGFIRCWGSETMTPEYFTAFLKHFSRMTDFMCAEYLETEMYWNNWATNETNASYWACMKFPEFKNSDYWYDCTVRHNYRLFNAGVFEDGVSVEQGMGYVVTWLNTVQSAVSTAQTISGSRDRLFCDENGVNILLNIVKNFYYSMAPGYGGFDFGDSMDYKVSYKPNLTKWYNILLYMGVDDPELEYVATDGKRGKLPDFTSISFPEAKRTYFRTDWSDDAISMGITAKGDNASHGHLDILSFALYAYGQYLLIDNSYGTVLTGEIYKIMKATDQHNTLSVNNEKVQIGATQDSETKELVINDDYNYVTYSSEFFRGATNVERSILFPKGKRFFIVSDYVVPLDQAKENSIQQYWHMLPSANMEFTTDGKYELRSNFDVGANVIVSPVNVEDVNNKYFSPSKYSPAPGSFIDNEKGVYEKYTYGPEVFNTIIYPLQAGEDRDIHTDVINTGIADNAAVAYRIMITDPKTGDLETYYYYHLNDVSKKQDVTLGKYKTDATTLLVQENMNGDAVSLFIYDGSYVEKDDIKDKYLYKTANGEKLSLSMDISSGINVEIGTDKFESDILKNVTFYVGHKIKSSNFNRERNQETKKDGAYMYFGNEPIVPCTEIAPENDDEENEGFDDFVGGSGNGSSGSGNSNGGSGGSGGGGSGGSFGGGGSGSSENKEPDITQDDKADDSAKPDITDDDKPKVAYYDVKEGDWYYDYVAELTEKGILSGDGTGNFAPDIKVTREQFLKMLLLATEIETEEAENTFKDVLDYAWYREYVLKAKTLGIVNGVSDTKFGVGANISRQDMAVMINRVIEIMETEIDEFDVETFDDYDKVSDYAKDSVNFMKSIGLIEGYNNEFRPNDSLTRAEAAKVISELMKLVINENN